MSRSVRTDYEALKIYEKHPEADAYRVGAGFTGYCIVAVEKRFTDAELMAEYFRQIARGMLAEDACEFTAAERIGAEAITLHRFASLPHFDE